MNPAATDGNSPISPDELEGLIPSLSTQEELNEWERENILAAAAWAKKDRTPATDVPSDEYIRDLHSKMFGETWKWAGKYRNTVKNIGVAVEQIREQLRALCQDVKYWIEHDTYPPDEIAVRFHHRLVQIHPFPNGNGRHARLIADTLLRKLGKEELTWGSKDLHAGEARARYLQVLRTADNGDIGPLMAFARS